MRGWLACACVVALGCSGSVIGDELDASPPTGTRGGDDAASAVSSPSDASSDAKRTPDVGCQPHACVEGDCGTIPSTCGGPTACGQCPNPLHTCGGGGKPNKCGCTPSKAKCDGNECGKVDDGCGGLIDCGDPGSGDACPQFYMCNGPSGKNRCSHWFDFCTSSPSTTTTGCYVFRGVGKYCPPSEWRDKCFGNTPSSSGCSPGFLCQQ